MTHIDHKIMKILKQSSGEISKDMLEAQETYMNLKRQGLIVPKQFDSDLMSRLTTGKLNADESIAARIDWLEG